MESSINVPASIGGNNMVRELFKVSGGDRTVKGVSVSVSRYSGAAPLIVALLASNDAVIDQVSIPSSQIAVDSTSGVSDGKLSRVGATFGTARKLLNGATYSVRISCASGTTYRTWSLRRGVSYGFHPSTYFADGSASKTTDNGATWGALRSGWQGTDDLQFQLTY